MTIFSGKKLVAQSAPEGERAGRGANKTITANSVVSMHFDIRLKDGSMADSTRNVGQPMQFTLGTGVFSEKLENELIGMKTGDKKKVMLMPEEAFGEAHPANVYHVSVDRFGEMELEEGLIVIFAQPNGTEMPGIIREIKGGEVAVDFNHPLAGQVVLFDLEIIAVE